MISASIIEIRWLTADRIMERIEEAVRTLRLLPGAIPAARLGCWPELDLSYWEKQIVAWDWEKSRWKAMAPPRIVATPRQRSEADEVLTWMTWVEPATAKILWARGAGNSWRRIADVAGKNKDTCIHKANVGIYTILHRQKKIRQTRQKRA